MPSSIYFQGRSLNFYMLINTTKRSTHGMVKREIVRIVEAQPMLEVFVDCCILRRTGNRSARPKAVCASRGRAKASVACRAPRGTNRIFVFVAHAGGARPAFRAGVAGVAQAICIGCTASGGRRVGWAGSACGGVGGSCCSRVCIRTAIIARSGPWAGLVRACDARFTRPAVGAREPGVTPAIQDIVTCD